MTPSLDSPARSSPSAVIAVSALNHAVARLLERSFPLAWIAGEISNFTRASSGHWYFTLKDETAQVRAVMFRGRAQYADFSPREGDKVEVRALVTLYAPRGDYQLSVESIRRAGVGNLHEAFQRLKENLAAEGLFDPLRKRPLPRFVKTIGIVTSLQAAALRDILTTLRRRAPHVHVVIYPTPVQGDGAAQKITQAIAVASLRAECEVLLVCRGGGSIEDLWSFNDEMVARAIVASRMPVIVGVGHETDFTIADFAADLRAPTPTAAAEMALVPRADWLMALRAHASHLNRAMARRVADAGQSIDWFSRRIVSPSTHIRHERLKLNGLHTRLAHAVGVPLAQSHNALARLQIRLTARRPESGAYRRSLVEHVRRLGAASSLRTISERKQLASLAAQLELLNPQRTLERGYAMITDAKGRIVRTPQELRPRDIVNITLANGAAQVGIASVQTSLE